MKVIHWPGNSIEEKFVCGTSYKDGVDNWSRELDKVTCKRCLANVQFIEAQKLAEEDETEIIVPEKSPLEGRHNKWIKDHNVKVGDLVIVVEKNTEDWPLTIINKTNSLVGITASIKEILGQGFILEGNPTVLPYSMLEYLSPADDIITQRPAYTEPKVVEAIKNDDNTEDGIATESSGEFNLFNKLMGMYGRDCRHTIVPNESDGMLVISEAYNHPDRVGVVLVDESHMTSISLNGFDAISTLMERLKNVEEKYIYGNV